MAAFCASAAALNPGRVGSPPLLKADEEVVTVVVVVVTDAITLDAEVAANCWLC